MLAELVISKKPLFIFLIETLCSRSKLESIERQLNYNGLFVVERMGRSGGLALLWKALNSVTLLKYANNFIDAEVEVPELGKWRLTGFYGFPKSSRRRESWDLLRLLAGSFELPWVCIGDFNDLLAATEKRGRITHPNWKLMGFQSAIADCQLIDLGVLAINLPGKGLEEPVSGSKKGLIKPLCLSHGYNDSMTQMYIA